MAYSDFIDYKYAIARGLTNHTTTIINAYTTTLSATTGFVLQPENKWANTMPAAATYVRITSTDANDATGGTGAINVAIEGILGSGTLAVETIEITGQTPATSTGQYIRINKMYIASAGSGGVNAGIIYCGETGDSTAAGVPKSTSTVLSMIAAGDNESHVGHYYIPAGYSGYLTAFGIGKSQDTAFGNTVKLFYKTGTVKKRSYYTVSISQQGYYNYPIEIPIKFDAGTDLWIEAAGGASATTINVDLQFLLVAGD